MKLSPRPWEAACTYHYGAAIEIFKIFADVFGDKLPIASCVVFLAGGLKPILAR